ncbi:M6 family metalloprotease domain-containing protein [candidate division WOR-3 bacterium]|uniref:M6 family metalloprotease domain-containing protein n=1 Tax=candidate division WOR-3 bacterium TaxID=2052148 RepID=A0A937XFN6_UNCW3|nr:M6 family metalloprotease domain-containing protein [candidate division WOR-3 bacterium]
MRIPVLLFALFAVALAMPPRPGVLESRGAPLPVFPPGVEVAGPNRLRDVTNLETVTILMQFPDNKADTLARSPARFDSMLYSTGVYNGLEYRAGSLNDYFLECSYGNYHVRGGIAGDRWFMSSYNYSRYYDGNYLLSTGDQLAEENMAQIDAYVDFSEFDLNNDNHIDAMFMVHAGADGSDNGDVNCLWSHAIPYFNYQTNDGVTIDGVTNVPEFAMVTEAKDTTMCCIAVMCHELGHLVGLPDLYTGSRNDWGPGYWSLMSYGAWGAGGNTPWSPSHPDAWCLNEAGFVTPTVVTTNLYNVRIPPVIDEPVVYKAWRGGTDRDTCFYLENRQKKGFDSPLPGAGLAIWHIDPSRSGMWNVVDLEEDSTFHLDHGFGYRPDPHVYHQEMGDTSDVLPGIWNRVVFDSASKPSSRDRSNRSTGVCIRNIRESGDTIICDIIVKPESVGIAQLPTPHSPLTPPQASPNPFSLEVYLSGLPARADARVYSAGGTLVWNAQVSAAGSLSWSGRNQSGARLPEGIYLVQLNGTSTLPVKVVLKR